MTSAEYNDRVREAARNQTLPGHTRSGPGRSPHHWEVRVEGDDDPTRLRVFVGAGAVNERVAAITYRRKDDPRGWNMPPDYPGLARLIAWFGADFDFVDRSLLDDDGDPPFLLLTLPDAGAPLKPHGFVKIADSARPRAFWGREDWEKELWRASVYLSAVSFRADPSLHDVPAGRRPPNQPARFRVFAGQLPTGTVGTEPGGVKEIGRIWLLRDSAGADELRIQQLAFWSLRCRPVSPFLDFGFGPIDDDGFFTSLLDLTIHLFEDAINALLEGLGGVKWWNV